MAARSTRREFIKKSGLAAAGLSVAPYILPSGRLFAPTGNRSSEHVVMVAFAGGVRQQESVLKRYLDDSQGEPYPGNIMYNMFSGDAPETKSSMARAREASTPSHPFFPNPSNRKARYSKK